MDADRPDEHRPRWRQRIRRLRDDVAVLAVALRDPRTPWLARVLAICVVAYAVSPIDLVPDFIPVLGLLDDLVLVPLGVVVVVRLVPQVVLRDSRARVRAGDVQSGRHGRVAAAAIVAAWCAAIAAGAVWLLR